MLQLQLDDRRKACFVDSEQHNLWKSPHPQREKVRAQYTFYDYLKAKNNAGTITPLL